METPSSNRFDSARTDTGLRHGASTGELATLTLAVAAVIGLSSLLL
ncbi:hypothetical protein [Halioglobus sp. HI00S01]|nr:hypothetical protein [Halioglobus sp. HI00S01]